jgi:YVTN family beta-propeller protein
MRSVLLWVCVLGIAIFAPRAFGGAEVTYNFQVGGFVESPNQSVIYATIPAQNAIAVINASTLQVTNTVPIGSNPAGLTISPDGSTLYVANSGSSFIARLNTATLLPLTPLVSPSGNPIGLEFGNNNRLWVLGAGAVNQIDATTGLSTGSGFGAYGGRLLISPDKNSLYYSNAGLTPSYAYKYDVSGTNPVQKWVVGRLGDGSAMLLNHAGTVFGFSDTGTAGVPLQDAASGLTLGTLGERGNALAVSADDSTIYTGIDFTFAVEVWSAYSYLHESTIRTASQPEGMFTDNTGNLFVSELGETEVFAVGAPEPSSFAIALLGFAGLLIRRRRR